MFPLAGEAFPSDAPALARAIEAALAEVLALPAKGAPVVVEEETFPAIKRLKVDLGGASVSATAPLPQLRPTGKRQAGIQVARLEVTGKPIRYEENRLEFSVHASEVRFDFAHDQQGRPMLVLTDAADGHVEAKISKADIESLVLTAAREVAKQQKVAIEDLELDLRQLGPRSIAAEARVTAKKMFVKGVIRLGGRLDIDDELNATLSDLVAEGEGAVGAMVAGIVRAKLRPHEGRTIPLMAFSLGDVAVRDLELSVKDDVQVKAIFGSVA